MTRPHESQVIASCANRKCALSGEGSQGLLATEDTKDTEDTEDTEKRRLPARR